MCQFTRSLGSVKLIQASRVQENICHRSSPCRRACLTQAMWPSANFHLRSTGYVLHLCYPLSMTGLTWVSFNSPYILCRISFWAENGMSTADRTKSPGGAGLALSVRWGSSHSLSSVDQPSMVWWVFVASTVTVTWVSESGQGIRLRVGYAAEARCGSPSLGWSSAACGAVGVHPVAQVTATNTG